MPLRIHSKLITNRPTGVLALGCLLVFIGTSLFSASALHAEDKQPASQALILQQLRADPHRILGVQKGDCKKCHSSEVAAWMKTTHYQSADLRLRTFTGNTKKYADALGIQQAELLKNSLCASCHATQSVVEGQIQVISGVSCESCHGGSGGKDGWLNRHQSYHASKVVPREQETEAHRKARLKHCEESGKLLSNNIQGLAKNCLSCHLINNEKLIASGHKAASAYDFVTWSDGEVRHNFHLNKEVNAKAPTLWLDETKSNPENRKRLKFVLGAMTQLESALRSRATMIKPAVIPQIGGIAAAANGKIAQINAVAGTEETQAVAAIVTPLLGLLFAPLPDDQERYTTAADKVAQLAKKFSESHDGSKLKNLDTILQLSPAHYSEQYKKKYGSN